MNTTNLISALHQRLKAPLPGWQSQWELSPLPGNGPQATPEQHRTAAVLSLLYPHDGELHVVLMKRTDDGRPHGGQISFPGGKEEPDDHHLNGTALREAEEELGILSEEVEILGDLTNLYIQASNFLVQPVVGYTANRPIFRPSPVEVDEILEVSLAQLLQTPVSTASVAGRGDLRFYTRAFQIQNHIIWGATAMMLNELLTTIRDISS